MNRGSRIVRRGLIVGLSVICIGPMLALPAQAYWRIELKHNQFSDPSIKIDRRDKVIWSAVNTRHRHSITATSGNWNKNTVLRSGDFTEYKFRDEGTYLYECRFHSKMRGTIVVR